MPDFLLELRSEEIPARMQAKARDDLARLFTAELAAAGITPGEITTYATPRRLALIAHDLPAETAGVVEELKGPRTAAPPQALEGFLRKTSLTADRLTERDGVWFALTEKPGRPTAELLAAAIPNIVRAFPWPKSMRWGAASLSPESPRWVRPLQGIVAILGDAIVPVSVAGVQAGAVTLGHRFHHPGPITLGGAHDYVEKLRACHVLVDQDERAAIIRAGAAALARDAGLELVEDEGLVAENAGLTEWPVPLLGRFDAAFLKVPPEVIQLTARVNQKYFVCRDADGKLADAFICTANIAATDGGARVVEGNRKVLAARLADARFFYEQDLRVPLDEQAAKLGKIVFHEKLGTVADKVDRVAKLARWLVEEGIVRSATPPVPVRYHPGEGRGPVTATSQSGAPTSRPASELDPGVRRGGADLSRDELAALAERAARLCKADLVTGMVGEFPELQGVMGGYYAAAQGEHPAVAEAIRDHYKPAGQGDEVPTAPVTVAVSLADKLDTLVSFFWIGEQPTGSRDPFALRRTAIAAGRLILTHELRLPLERAAELPVELLGSNPSLTVAGEIGDAESVSEGVLEFISERLRIQQKELGLRHDFWNAVYTLDTAYKAVDDDLVRLLARVHALQAFVGTEDGANLLAGYKRAANILKKEGWSAPQLVTPAEAGVASGEVAPARDAIPAFAGMTKGGGVGAEDPLPYTPEPEEAALRTALDSAEPRAAAAVEAEDFEGAMAALASLRPPIDAFFDRVTVNDPDPAKRATRLDLLARVRDAVHRVADFSKIEG